MGFRAFAKRGFGLSTGLWVCRGLIASPYYSKAPPSLILKLDFGGWILILGGFPAHPGQSDSETQRPIPTQPFRLGREGERV